MSLASASQAEIQRLSTSAAFAMSLGAKELFHTNFLAFLLESDEPTLEQVQLALRGALDFPVTPGALTRCAVWREKNNLDLVVVELRSEAVEPAGQGNTVSKPRSSKGQAPEVAAWDWLHSEGWHQHPMVASQIASVSDEGATVRNVHASKVLVIEAKLKSVPRLDQLIGYDNLLARKDLKLDFPDDAVVPEWTLNIGSGGGVSIERRLLCVSGSSVITPDVPTAAAGTLARRGSAWKGVSWDALHSAMSPAIGTLAESPMRETVTDYIQVLGALVALLNRVRSMCDAAHDPDRSSPSYGALRKQVLDPKFISLRIHDLLGKSLYDFWLTKYICKILPSSAPVGWSTNHYVNYSNGVPGLGVELVNRAFLTEDRTLITLRIGVQIQDREFRLFIDVDKEWRGLESWVANSEVLIRQWFSTPVFGKTPVGLHGQTVATLDGLQRKTNLKVFNPCRFLFSKVDIDDQPIDRVEAEIANLVAHAARLLPDLLPP